MIILILYILITIVCIVYYIWKGFKTNHEEIEYTSVDNDRIADSKINIEEYKIKKKKALEKRKEEKYYKKCILFSLGVVMKADGRLKRAELDRVQSIINRYYKTPLERSDALDFFYSILNSKNNDLPKSIFRKINTKLIHVAQKEIIMELLSVAYADDKYDNDEQKIIEFIARDLYINDTELASIHKIFREKYNKGFYNDKSQNTNSQSDKESNNKNVQDINDAYIKLGVSSDTSDIEIQKVYHALVIQYHPDNFEKLGDEAIRQATETMKQINIAWDVVKKARGIK